MLLYALLLVAQTQQPTWTVSARPALRIGEVDAAQPYMFAQITGAVRLSDGRIVVADGASNQLRAYNARGQHIVTRGGTGGGPGEFQGLRALWLATNDTIIAYDSRNGRISFFDSQLQLARSEQGPPLPVAVGRTADGSYIATQGLAPPDKREDFRGLIDFEGIVFRRAPGAAAYDSIIRGAKAGQSFVQPVMNSFRQYPYPYGRTAQIAVGRTRFYYGDTHSTQLRIYDARGQRVGDMSLRGSGRELNRDDIERWIEYDASRRPSEAARTETREAMRQIPPPRRTPEFGVLRIDDANNLWVRRYGPPWNLSPDWDIYDANGRALAHARTPARFEPMHIGRDFVLGVSKDELEVERIELFTITR